MAEHDSRKRARLSSPDLDVNDTLPESSLTPSEEYFDAAPDSMRTNQHPHAFQAPRHNLPLPVRGLAGSYTGDRRTSHMQPQTWENPPNRFESHGVGLSAGVPTARPYPNHQSHPGYPSDPLSQSPGPPPYSPTPSYRSMAPATPLVRHLQSPPRAVTPQGPAAGSTGLQDHGYQRPSEGGSRGPSRNFLPQNYRPPSPLQDPIPPPTPRERLVFNIDDNNVGCSRTERSTGCVNSSRLINCQGCVNSSQLENCTDCVNSSRCTNSTDLVDCSRCDDCRSCVGCSNCSGLVDEVGVSNKHA